MNKKIFDRQNIIGFIIIIALVAMITRLANITIVNGEYYSEKAINNRIKRISEVAQRGEIFDRNGVLMAGNMPAFTVQFIGDGLDTKTFNNVAIHIMDLLKQKDEKSIEFPIVIEDGQIVYSYDLQILDWLKSNGYDAYVSAETVFEDIRNREQISPNLDNFEAQKFMILKGITLPISVRTMKYLEDMHKEDFLKSYGVSLDATPEEALKQIRAIKSYNIDESLSDEDALKVLTLRYALKLKGYLAYNPIKIADNVSEDTAVLIQEMGMELPGVNIAVEPIRYYPQAELGAHILGYLGKISSESEVNLYIDELGYDRNDIIGKVGIEGEFESVMKGTDGYRFIEVDAYGRFVKDVKDEYSEIQSVLPRSGGDIELTIDTELQKSTEDSLKKWIEAIQQGGTFEDPWGSVTYDQFEKAESGAAVVLDVQTGEVLALANYPTYDLNLFATGISFEDWNNLTPDNPKNPLAPRPLYNTATLTAVQPGSTFKMITGIAALEQGLDPDRELYADGFVEVGNNTFGCWFWNDYHAKHGPTTLYEALEVSCNYYFFDLAMGMDYKNNVPLGIDMNATILIDYAKAMGLNEATGIEIPETVRGVPDEEKKTRAVLWGLNIKLSDEFDKYFPSSIAEDDERVEEIITEILSWAEEKPSRAQIIRDLIDLGAIDDYYFVEDLADIIKYDYFNRIGWFEGDTLNMAIGQGDHLYSPIQMARYIMAIANDGYLYDLTLIRKLNGVTYNRNLNIDPVFGETDTFEIIRKGMYEVAQGDSGTARKYFYDFPVNVGAKTGTAEKEGKIPPLNEEQYFLDNLELIDPSISFEELKKRAEFILIERNNELAKYEMQKDETDDEEIIKKLTSKIDSLITSDYLTLGSAMREGLKLMSQLELTDTIINQYREDYNSYAWFVGFAPYENPEIAVVVFIPQGGHGGYAAPIARDIMAAYLDIEAEVE